MTRRVGRPPKLTREQAQDLRFRRLRGDDYDALARRFGISRSTVRRYSLGECRQYRDVPT